jgi:formyl-CoA transferase
MSLSSLVVHVLTRAPLFGRVESRPSATPGRVRHPGPALGENNDEIYRGLLGLGDSEMAKLTAAGVI